MPNQPLRCNAVKRDGQQCKNLALPNKELCGTHARQSKSKLKKIIEHRAKQVKFAAGIATSAFAVCNALHTLSAHWDLIVAAATKYLPFISVHTLQDVKFATTEKTISDLATRLENATTKEDFDDVCLQIKNQLQLVTVVSDTVATGLKKRRSELEYVQLATNLATAIDSFWSAVREAEHASNWNVQREGL